MRVCCDDYNTYLDTNQCEVVQGKLFTERILVWIGLTWISAGSGITQVKE